jgi:hypothetical protein
VDAAELVELLRQRIQEEGGFHQFAAKHGICYGNLTKVVYCGEKPGPQIALALGMKKVVSFEPIK